MRPFIWRGRAGRPWGFPREPKRADVGRWGEWLALKHLRRLGWDVVARNWHARRGEIDLIAYHGSVLVFIEVRTRLASTRVRPEETIDEEKQRRIESAAWEFLKRYELGEVRWRMDRIAIETRDCREFELRHYGA